MLRGSPHAVVPRGAVLAFEALVAWCALQLAHTTRAGNLGDADLGQGSMGDGDHGSWGSRVMGHHG